MIDNSVISLINHKRLREGINQHQPVIETLFNTSLGEISLSSFSTYKNHITFWYGFEFTSPSVNRFAFVLPEFADEKSNTVFYRKNKLFSKEDGLYLAIHEMAHLGHKLSARTQYNNFSDDYHEFIADLVAVHLTPTIDITNLHPTLAY